MTEQLIQAALLSLFALAAVVIARTDNLFSAAFLAGMSSLLMAALYLSLDAPDVAFTEAAVGAGISTVFYLAAIAAASEQFAYTASRKLSGLMLAAAAGWLIYYSMLDMPYLADASLPTHGHVARYYLDSALAETGVPNVVTAVLASYRGFDTLGEVSVIFTAGIGAMIVFATLKDGGRRRREED